MSSPNPSPSSTVDVTEPGVSRYSRFIEHLDEAPAIRPPNTRMSLIWRTKAQSPQPHSSPETTQAPFQDEAEHPVGKSLKIRISNTHLQRSNAIHRPRRSRTPHPTARHIIRVVDGPGPVTFSASKWNPNTPGHHVPDDEIPPLDLGPPLSPLLVVAQKRRGSTETELPGYPGQGRKHMNESGDTFDYDLVETSPMAEQGPARNGARGRLSKVASKIADGVSYLQDCVITGRGRR